MKPNILFIIADDHRHDAIGAFGDPTVQTPTLDALAGRGVACRGTHIMGGLSGAVCVPTRAAVHSGVSIFRATPGPTDTYETVNTINPTLKLMPQTFSEHGYRTFATGKWHNDKASFNRCFADGANIFFGGMSDHDKVPIHQYDASGAYPEEEMVIADGFSTELFCDSAIKFLNTKPDEPFFLYISMTSPHDPRMAPPPFDAMYDPREIPVPPSYLDEHPFDNGDMILRDELLAPYPRTKPEMQQHIADYYGMISHHDQQLGRVFDTLAANGQLENTIIVYTSDHGLSVGQHGLLGKQNMYDHSVRIPCILAGPSLPQGLSLSQLTYQIDIFPTLCELAGIPIPSTVEGKSFKPLIDNPAGNHRETVYSLYRDIQRMVTDGEWKLTRHYVSPITGAGTDRLQLFHLADDPWETRDLSQDAAHQYQMQRLAEHLNQWMHETDDFMKESTILL